MGVKKREHPKPGTLIRILPNPNSKSGVRERWIKEYGTLYVARASHDDILQCTSLATGKKVVFINDYWEVADEDEA